MKKKWHLPLLIILVIGSILIIRQQYNMPYQHNKGMIFGTFYSITYQHPNDLQKEIEAELKKVDEALSPFNKKSIITAVNENRTVTLNKMFIDVFTLAKEVSEDTEGAFDITVAPYVNAWGFGFKNNVMPTPEAIDSLSVFVGFEKVEMRKNTIVKKDPRITLDCSAIAKGYGVDVIAKFFHEKEIKNFLIEIGGEIYAYGVNAKHEAWGIGVEKPEDDSLSVSSDLVTVLKAENIAMATSGNYRNFYYKDGKKYAHTIDPRTGNPVQHNILSATVLCNSCAKADAYATAFMVLGLEKAKEILSRHREMKAFLIYQDNDSYGVWKSPGL